MANKVWVGTETAYGNLSARQLDDEYFTTTTESFSHSYHILASYNTIKNMSLSDYQAITPSGLLSSTLYASTATATKSLPVMNRLYRGKGGTDAELLVDVQDISNAARNKYFY